VSTSSQADSHAGGIEKPGQAAFVTTHWSVVLAAGSSDTTRSQDALGRLCHTYWHSLYALARRRGYSQADAQDLTQDFFAQFLERGSVATADPGKGRFRSFLLASMNNFLSDSWDKARAQKRGAGKVISLDTQTAEAWLNQHSSDSLNPDEAFEYRWTISLLEEVHRRLETEFRLQGKASQFEVLRSSLAGHSTSAPYAELGRQLAMSEGAVKVAVHRLRRRYRELLRETIAETVSSQDEVEDELRYLFRTLAR
jgi:RNA polymerase sigma factor (sigma-70 family)